MTDDTNEPGPTGDYPDGQMEPSVAMRISARGDGRVLIEFGTAVQWFAMDPEEAGRFAAVVIAKAREARGL